MEGGKKKGRGAGRGPRVGRVIIPSAAEIEKQYFRMELINAQELFYGLGHDSSMTTKSFGPIVREQ